MGAVQVFSGFAGFRDIRSINNAWQNFDVSRSEKSRALVSLYREIGYGGMIHNFKNFILRGDSETYLRIHDNVVAATAALEKYNYYYLEPEETRAIKTIEDTIALYDEKSRDVLEHKKDGLGIRELDARVKIDDGPALAALTYLAEKALFSKQHRDEHGRMKIVLLSDIRRSLGYGGLIHNFKNYVIRNDPDLLPPMRRNISNLRSYIQEYYHHIPNEHEAPALVALEQTIESYALMLDVAVDENARPGATPAAIDRLVRVDDGPALRAFATLFAEIVREEEARALTVENSFKSVFATLGTQMVLTTVLSLLVAAFVVFTLHGLVIAPVLRIGEAMTRLAHGDTTTPEDEDVKIHKNEIGEMENSVAVFRAAAIRQRHDRKELMIAKEAAETANRAKSEFLSSMSHELRTPLNAIIGFGQLLEMGQLDDDQKESVHEIMKAGDHLLNLIGDVLDLAKIESGDVSISIENVEIASVLDQCVVMGSSMAKKYGVTVLLPVQEENLPMLKADRTRMKQVLLNFISNAAKYNRKGGTVSINVSQSEDGFVRFSVTDTGIGIPRSKQQKIFVPFNRLGHEGSGVEGTGIGLAITKDLVEIMGGRIGFTSVEGEGSTFWFELPPVDTQYSPPRPGSADEAGPGKNHDYGFARGKVVLCVEDNPSNIRLMEMLFRRIPGASLVVATSGEEGIAMALETKPDMVLMDINLPGISGIETMQELKKIAATASIPVVALSAAAMENDIARGFDAGFDGYLTKPVEMDDLLQSMREALS